MLFDTLVLDWRKIVTLWLLKPFLVNQNWFLFSPLSFSFHSFLSPFFTSSCIFPSSSFLPPISLPIPPPLSLLSFLYPPSLPPSLQVAGIMDQFERQFEHLDVQTQTMEEAMSGVTTLTVPEVGR